MNTTPSPATLKTLQSRRDAGESLSVLAGEVGLPWQRLWSLMRQGPAGGEAPQVRPRPAGEPLVKRYRPSRLDEIWGQAHVVSFLRAFAAAPYPLGLLLEGQTGTGKTSAALALAAELGCELEAGEFGGVHCIASGDQTAEAVREAHRQMHQYPWQGSGWKVVVVNEADRMSRAAETIWLDVLEAIPDKTVVVFTTNEAARLSQRFLDRCVRLAFESRARALAAAAEGLLAAIWSQETGRRAKRGQFRELVARAAVEGELSFRRAVQALQPMLTEGHA